MSKEKYEQALNYYYRNYNKCPKCHIELEKSTQHKIDINCSQCGYKIKMDLRQTVNLMEEIESLKADKQKLLADIMMADGKEKLEEYKKRIEAIDSKVKEYTKTVNLENKNLEKMQETYIGLVNDLVELYFERKNIYERISAPLTNEQKTLLMNVYKNEGIPKDARIQSLGKQMKVKSEDVRLWMEWFDVVLKYIRKTKESGVIKSKIDVMEEDHKRRIENYIIDEAKVLEFDTKVKKIVKIKPKIVSKKIKRV